MHNTVTPLHTAGISLELFHCSYDQVQNWGDPVLRSTFWRCYLATTRGAALQSSRREWALLPKALCIIPPDSPIRGKSSGPFTLYYAHFNCSIRLKKPDPLFVSANPTLELKLREALELNDEHLFRSSMLALTADALRQVPADLLRAPISDSRIEKAHRLMKEHIGSRLSNSQIAAWLNMSEASLLRLFRSATGTSPQKEHLRIRLEHAAVMLRETEATIEAIADSSGFWDRNHFTRVFTREYHAPPARYRITATSL